VRDVIPPINYRRYDPAIDGELYTPPTPPPVDATTDEPNDLLTPINPPVTPMEPEVTILPYNPTDPPTSLPPGTSTETFSKFKQRFFNLFK
jgi:hypothetical protein